MLLNAFISDHAEGAVNVCVILRYPNFPFLVLLRNVDTLQLIEVHPDCFFDRAAVRTSPSIPITSFFLSKSTSTWYL